MKFTKVIKISVNGKIIQATVHLDAPGLESEDCLSARMILTAVANEQNIEYRSRHHSNRIAKVDVNPDNIFGANPCLDLDSKLDTNVRTRPIFRLVA